MKRVTKRSLSFREGRQAKKPCLDSPESNSFAAIASEESSEKQEDGEWTKVERRKMKKAKNMEAKLSVCGHA
jgi:hypothetical protein